MRSSVTTAQSRSLQSFVDKDDDDDAVETDDVVDDDDDDDETRGRRATTRDDDGATGGDARVGVGGERTSGGCRRRRCGRERVIHGVDAEKEENAERERARDGSARSRRGEHYE